MEIITLRLVFYREFVAQSTYVLNILFYSYRLIDGLFKVHIHYGPPVRVVEVCLAYVFIIDTWRFLVLFQGIS